MEPKRCSLVLLPTPMHRLERASDALGIELWIKRDDLTGFALGGNKGRKLEYIIGDALAKGADTIVTCGSTQSNFVRQLAAACAIYQLRCVAVICDLPFEHKARSGGLKLSSQIGNPQLNRLLGAEIIHLDDMTWDELYIETEKVANSRTIAGERVYSVPVGGSSALGAYAFLRAAEEIKDSGQEFDWIITATSSGSTQVGLTYGFTGRDTRVLGIAADPEPDLVLDLVELGRKLSLVIGREPLLEKDFHIELGWVGPGYGVTDPTTVAALQWLARKEGIILDPIYTAKAFAGLLELSKSVRVGGRVLFWHTGGTPTVFAI